jgi:hypothetical protein
MLVCLVSNIVTRNIGVLQTTVAELVTVKEHQGMLHPVSRSVIDGVMLTELLDSSRIYYHAYGLEYRVSQSQSAYTKKTSYSNSSSFSSIIGPMIGGALARPCISYPDYFPRGSIWDKYPYLLPNLFSAATVLFGVVIGILFLEETHLSKKAEKDRGREIGDRIASLFGKATYGRADKPEKQSLLGNSQHTGYDTISGSSSDAAKIPRGRERLPDYRSRETSPRVPSQENAERQTVSNTEPSEMQPGQTTKIFTKPVLINIISYGILAL